MMQTNHLPILPALHFTDVTQTSRPYFSLVMLLRGAFELRHERIYLVKEPT
ncbi:hypothetical protein [Ktedonosporobacter rubrisoli]|uniref:hypothetical protein n=1 Tax=Ktedonosporobacter rubrisoli TaxID=2509675 RepID=UPI0013EE7A0B|nr:hypothetical protein [Ktedonosporobacter rubrisoli]